MQQASRQILHVDQNCFYANVECAEHPELRGRPVAVGGDVEKRHGIILAKNQEAKAAGVKTAETLWQARLKCPELIILPPDYRLYMRYSALARRIYYDYTDLVEPFGPDEAWLDVTGSAHLQGGVDIIAREISERIKAELGLTVSIGVSWNKIFAKFGSDYKKPDAITWIDTSNYRTIVWEAPVRELLYVGAATETKLRLVGINTIGDIAQASAESMRGLLGKVGEILRIFARGEDTTSVKPYDLASENVERGIKSYGNGLTAPHDISNPRDAKALVYLLAESVAQRMREGRARACTIGIGVRDASLGGYVRQMQLASPTNATAVVAACAWKLLRANEPLDETRPLRSLHVRTSSLSFAGDPVQMALFDDEGAKMESLDNAVDDLRRRFGNRCILRGVELCDTSLNDLDIKRDNVVHPVGFFHV
ncbi:MAG: DNA polymerase IV [Coriobacteriia bacterium]|nr:DNA polymerase IV [Coriobacteriia bacterium]